MAKKTLAFIICIVSATITFILAYLSEGTYESGDSINHFLIAKYAFKHPELLLDHWGKPFFTLLASPFAQFGFIGINTFNILCATTTGYIGYLLAQKLELKNAWLAPLFILFVPIYYVTLISGLTEPLFALVLIASICLYAYNKKNAAAIVLSVLPFIRTEGFLLLPILGVLLIKEKNAKAFLLLGTGTLIYSIIGGIYFNDFLWILHNNPYKGAKHIYGSGSLFHFIDKNEFILGIPLVVLFILGVLFLFIDLKTTTTAKNELRFLICLSFTVYFIAHSIFWWKGIVGSLGLIRVMAGVTPLAALLALLGFEKTTDWIQNAKIKMTVTLLISMAIIIMPFKQHAFPRPLGYEDKVVQQACEWVKDEKLTNNKIYYLYPYVAIFLNLDPFDKNKCDAIWGLPAKEIKNLPSGTLIIWDSHLAANEGGMALSSIHYPEEIKLLNKFECNPADVPGDKELFSVYVFVK